jgi:hypothetical protein
MPPVITAGLISGYLGIKNIYQPSNISGNTVVLAISSGKSAQ